MTINEIAKALADAGIEDSSFEARILCDEFSGKELENALSRRIKREPLQYIIGKWPFFREEYFVSPDCLIPRSDTEILVEHLVKKAPEKARFLDLCTGSGCIAISYAKNRPDSSGIAADISEAALKMAKKNALHNDVSNLDFIKADVTKPSAFAEKFDFISANPPYITSAAMEELAPELSHEPRIALHGGEDGMFFYRAILKNYIKNLKNGGSFVFEFGYDQKDDAKELANEYSLSFLEIYDYGGNFRVAVLTKGE